MNMPADTLVPGTSADHFMHEAFRDIQRLGDLPGPDTTGFEERSDESRWEAMVLERSRVEEDGLPDTGS